MGDEAFSGITSPEADAPVSHTRKQDVLWFYGTIFLAPALAALCAIGAALAVYEWRRPRTAKTNLAVLPKNPLQIPTALIFAALIVVISIVSAWVRGAFGESGILVLSAVGGATAGATRGAPRHHFPMNRRRPIGSRKGRHSADPSKSVRPQRATEKGLRRCSGRGRRRAGRCRLCR